MKLFYNPDSRSMTSILSTTYTVESLSDGYGMDCIEGLKDRYCLEGNVL